MVIILLAGLNKTDFSTLDQNQANHMIKTSQDHWKAKDYVLNANYVSALAQEVIRDLAPQKSEDILDIGCGDGELAAVVQSHGARVVGIDSSTNLVAAAQDRGVDARVEDAQNIKFECAFDAAFSNAALHWMPQQQNLINRVFVALKPGGRFVVEMGGAGNIDLICQAMSAVLAERDIDFAMRNPWTFPTADEQRNRLQKTGFRVTKCRLRKRPTTLPTDIIGWLNTFGSKILSDFSTSDRNSIMIRMAEQLRPQICSADGTWTADYVRLNFVAIKP